MMPQDSSDARSSQSEPETAETKGAESLKQALAEERKKAEDYLSSWQRAQADFINYKRRTEQERQDFSRFANANLILSLLPLLDDLSRAFDAVPDNLAAHSWLDGIKLIERKLRTSLEAQGLAPIKAVGEPFDPNLHEALRQDKGQEGIVIGELQKGYMLYDKLLRPAQVVVGNGEEEKKEEQ